MARYKRIETLTLMREVGIIPVFYNADFEVAKNVVAACADGGARLVEFVNRGDRAINVFTALEEAFAKEKPEVVMGVGSIVDAPTAAAFIGAGANFVVGPLLDQDTALLCNSRKIPYSPGCGTMSEIHQAHRLGVDIVKIFPGGTIGGPAFVKNAKGPCPWVDIMPTGGVSPTRESLSDWFGAGIVCAGMGSKLVTKDLLAAKDYKGITKAVKSAIDLVKEIKGGK